MAAKTAGKSARGRAVGGSWETATRPREALVRARRESGGWLDEIL